MARTSWLDDSSTNPRIEERLEKLEHFTTALADGVVDEAELEAQQQFLVEAMKAVEGELSDALHEKVTRVLVELTAYNVMLALHEFASASSHRKAG